MNYICMSTFLGHLSSNGQSEAMKHTVLTGLAILVQSASNFVVKMIEFKNSISIVKKLEQTVY